MAEFWSRFPIACARRVASPSTHSGPSESARLERDFARREEAPVVLGRALRDVAEVQRPALDLELAVRDSCHVEEVVHEPREVPHLAGEDLVRSRRGLRVRALMIEDVEAAPDGRERVPQLVRQHGKELVLPPVRVPQGLLGALAAPGPRAAGRPPSPSAS